MSGDPLANVLRRQGRLTRENYLMLGYLGKPAIGSDGQLDAEAEQLLPEELQGPDDPPGGQHPTNALLCDYPLLEFYRILLLLWSGERK